MAKQKKLKMWDFRSMAHMIARIMLLMTVGMALLTVIALTMSFINHNIQLSNEEVYLQPPGVMVEVDGHQMHVYETGNLQAEDTLVFMHNVADTDASIMFRPLFDDLSDDYHIVYVDRPGNGFSEKTKNNRDTDAMLEEIRTAMKEAGIEGDAYTLVAFGTAGMIGFDWADTYPEEVKGMITINPSYPEQYRGYEESIFSPLSKKMMVFYTGFGGVRFAKALYPANEDGLYTVEEMNTDHALISKKFYTNNMYKEEMQLNIKAQQLLDEEWNEEIPLLVIMTNPLLDPYFSNSEETQEEVAYMYEKYPDVDFAGLFNQADIEYFSNWKNTTVIEMDGTSDLYSYDHDEMKDEIVDFLTK